MDKNKQTAKTNPIIFPFSMDENMNDKLLRHRHLTGLPTSRHLRKLVEKDIADNPKDYGINS